MWSYYGRKSKIIKHYPAPVHDKIIEPFAGTAVYSLHNDNWKRDVLIIEKYKTLIDIWEYLQEATPSDILALPDTLVHGMDIRSFTSLSEPELSLMGFWINHGSTVPKRTVMKWAAKPGYWGRTKQRIADSLHKIKHWEIVRGDFSDASEKSQRGILTRLINTAVSITFAEIRTLTIYYLRNGANQDRGRLLCAKTVNLTGWILCH